MRPAIPALLEAVGSNDRSASSISNALEAISTLSTNGAFELLQNNNMTTDIMIHRIDDYRADLVPAVHKLVQKLGGWDDDEAYPLDLIKALPTLAEHSTSSLNESVTHPNFSSVQSEEFRSKLKHIVPILMEKLQKGLHGYVIDCTCLTYQLDLRNNTLDQDSDNNKVAFYQEACKLISKLCSEDTGMAACATCVLK
jgi:hypothetical protein